MESFLSRSLTSRERIFLFHSGKINVNNPHQHNINASSVATTRDGSERESTLRLNDMAKNFWLSSLLFFNCSSYFLVSIFGLRLVIAYFAFCWLRFYVMQADDDTFDAKPHVCEVSLRSKFKTTSLCWFNQLKRDEDCSFSCQNFYSDNEILISNVSIASRREILYSSSQFVELWTWISQFACFGMKAFCCQEFFVFSSI